MTETEFKEKVMRYIKRKYPDAWVWKTSDNFYSGIPDLCVVLPPHGKVYWLELKTIKGRVEPIQTYTINRLKNVGCTAAIVRSMDEVAQIL